MPKSWPCDRTRRHKGQKTNKEVPSLPGWEYFEAVSNMFIYCQNCKKLKNEMFYRYVKEPGQSVGVTDALCVDCGLKQK